MTKIVCAYCDTQYEIDQNLIGDKPKKFLCAKCKKVFSYQKDENDAENVIVSAIEDENIATEIKEELKEEVKEELKEEVKEEVKEELVEDIKEEIKEELVQEVKEELVQEVKEELAEDLKEEVKEEVKEELKEEVADSVTKINDVFQRLEKNSQELNEEEATIMCKKDIFCETIGWTSKKNKAAYVAIIILLTLLTLNFFKFEITRKIPVMEYAYAMVGIDSIVPGEGLKFINVEKEEYLHDFINYMEIKGYIENTATDSVRVPRIAVSLLTDEAYFLQTQVIDPPAQIAAPQDRISFKLIIKKPSPLAEYIYLTFTK